MAVRQNTRYRIEFVLGAVLVLAGIGTALYHLWPDIEYRTGLTQSGNPYASRFEVPTEDAGRAGAKAIPSTSRVVIPRVGIDVRIFGGDIEEALSRGVYHYAASSKPGQPGNVVIAGHRNRRQFALLPYLRLGDDISVYWEGSEHCYRVTRVYRVAAVESEILASGDEEMLTLYTCTPRFVGDKRVVVVAEPVRIQ